MPNYLILEDDQEFFDRTYLASYTDSQSTDKEFAYLHVKTVEEAREALANKRFSGAILDLRLKNGEIAEGNEIAIQIHQDYFMPIAVVTGHTDELDSTFHDLATTGTGFLRLFNKNKGVLPAIAFLGEIVDSGILQIVGPGGELNKMISDIFWKHLGEVVQQWKGQNMAPADQKRVLRHAVSHMIGALQSNEQGDWDNFLPSEIYIWPPICSKEMPGHIYEENVRASEVTPVVVAEKGPAVAPAATASAPRKRYFLLVTPYCDLTKMSHRHFIEVLPFSDFSNVDRTKNILDKKDHRYHILPPTSFFAGGVADFASLITISSEEQIRRFIHQGSLIEPFWRELVNRLGAWLGRQGTPEFDKAKIIDHIKSQWPTVPPITKK